MSPEHGQTGAARLEEGLSLGLREINDDYVEISTPDTQAETEKHSTNSGLVRDAIIGLAVGLTVPFALTAGLSS
jgi:hypothetical protein